MPASSPLPDCCRTHDGEPHVHGCTLVAGHRGQCCTDPAAAR